MLKCILLFIIGFKLTCSAIGQDKFPYNEVKRHYENQVEGMFLIDLISDSDVEDKSIRTYQIYFSKADHKLNYDVTMVYLSADSSEKILMFHFPFHYSIDNGNITSKQKFKSRNANQWGVWSLFSKLPVIAFEQNTNWKSLVITRSRGPQSWTSLDDNFYISLNSENLVDQTAVKFSDEIATGYERVIIRDQKFELTDEERAQYFDPDHYEILFETQENQGDISYDSIVNMIYNGPVLLSDGSEVNMDTIQSEVIVIEYFWTRCYPCIRFLPELKKIHNNYTKDELTMVSLTNESLATIKNFKDKHDIPYFIGRANSPILINCAPTFIVLDKDRNIIYNECGAKKSVVKAIERVFETSK